jgi:hypothetical protein
MPYGHEFNKIKLNSYLEINLTLTESFVTFA